MFIETYLWVSYILTIHNLTVWTFTAIIIHKIIFWPQALVIDVRNFCHCSKVPVKCIYLLLNRKLCTVFDTVTLEVTILIKNIQKTNYTP